MPKMGRSRSSFDCARRSCRPSDSSNRDRGPERWSARSRHSLTIAKCVVPVRSPPGTGRGEPGGHQDRGVVHPRRCVDAGMNRRRGPADPDVWIYASKAATYGHVPARTATRTDRSGTISAPRTIRAGTDVTASRVTGRRIAHTPSRTAVTTSSHDHTIGVGDDRGEVEPTSMHSRANANTVADFLTPRSPHCSSAKLVAAGENAPRAVAASENPKLKVATGAPEPEAEHRGRVDHASRGFKRSCTSPRGTQTSSGTLSKLELEVAPPR